MLLVCPLSLRIWRPVFLVILSAVAVVAGVEDYEGKPVGIIAFEPKEQPIPPSELAEILPLKMKRPFRSADVRAAIEQLFATGRYADIVVDADLRNGEVIVRFSTKGNWFVGRVTVDGVPAPPSRGQLGNATKLDLGIPFHDEDIQAALARLRETLESNGFYKSQVGPSLDRDSRTQQVHIHFQVAPGMRARFAPPVISGDSGNSGAEIAGATKWRGWFGWKPVTQAHVQTGLGGVRRFYQKQNHLMAQVALEKIDYDPATGRATPRLRIEKGPIVLVEARGEKLSGGHLKELVPVFEEGAVDRDLIQEGARNISEYYQKKGYFEARVDASQEPWRNGTQRIVYTIDRGRRHKLDHLEIRGNSYFDLATIRERMFVASASPQLRRGRYSEALLRQDVEAITELYRSNGFRNVQVSSKVQDDYNGKAGNVAVLFDIREGPQWFVAGLEIDGVSPEEEKRIRSLLQSGPGQAFSEANVAADRGNILASFYNRGYSDASFEWNYQPSSKPNQVNLRYVILEGSRQFVREVLIGGLDTTQRRLVYRRILLNPGEPISQTQILETQRRLYDLGIFAKVDTAIQNPEGEEQNKYVMFQLEESKKISISTGFGAEVARIGRGDPTSLEAPAGKPGFSPRVSFDISRLNFLGRAHTVSFRSRVSNIQRRGLLNYFAPQFRGAEKIDLSLSALFDDSRDILTFSSRRWEGSLQFAQRWTRSKTLFYRFAYRRVAVGNVNIRRDLIPRFSQAVRVGIVSVGYADDRRDDPTDSHKGTYNSLDLGWASNYFGSETDYFRLLGRNSTYYPIGGRLVLARTLLLGWIQTLRTGQSVILEDQDIPLPERFFAGGASTHRGFPENQAGPRDFVTGFPVGGKAMLMLGNELRYPLYGDNIGGVLFWDAGNVYSRAGLVSFRVHQRDEKDFNYMVHAVGFGIRYRTPIGPIRVDLAFVPNSPRFFGFKGTYQDLLDPNKIPDQTQQRISQFQFHFSLGQSF